jgi:uncharacterized repeat protein (TIGR03803 family)
MPIIRQQVRLRDGFRANTAEAERRYLEGTSAPQLPRRERWLFSWGNLAFDSAGNLYGATEFGGGYGSCDAPYYQYCGTVFEVSPPTVRGGKWTEKVLHAFKSVESGKQLGDGASPNGGLVFDSKGALYGTTYYGGNQACGASGWIGCGTVFELEPPTSKRGAWTEKILLRLKSDGSMGDEPAAGVIFGPSDDLYGTTLYGGQVPTKDNGTVFSLGRSKDGSWNETLLHSFPFGGFGGSDPLAGVIFDGTGNIYGTTSYGGSQFEGTVFQLAPPGSIEKSWTYKALYSFGKYPDGNTPEANLTFDKLGNLYGTTVYGGVGYECPPPGQYHCGTVFELQP